MRPRRTLIRIATLVLLLGACHVVFVMGYKVYFEITYRTVQYTCDLTTHNREVAKKKVSEMKTSLHGDEELNAVCQPHSSRNKLKQMRPEFYDELPLFINDDFQTWSQSHEMELPFGMVGSENELVDLLKLVNTTTYPAELTRKDCTTCIVVGSAGLLADSEKGPVIDSFDVVIRVNGGPTRCFETDVGARTTMRITYPEGAPQNPGEYDPESIFVLVPFKNKDLEWLDRVATNKPVSWMGYWRPRIAQSVPIPRSNFRILNPELVRHAAFDLVKFPTHGGKNIKNIPTTGAISIIAALSVCDEVSVAGFGYDPDRPDSKVHYYEDMKMDTAFALPSHDLHGEKQFLRDLVKYGVIKDLTGGILR